MASPPAITHYSSVPVCESLSPQPLNLSSSGWSKFTSRHSNPNGEKKILLRFVLKVLIQDAKCCIYQENVCQRASARDTQSEKKQYFYGKIMFKNEQQQKFCPLLRPCSTSSNKTGSNYQQFPGETLPLTDAYRGWSLRCCDKKCWAKWSVWVCCFSHRLPEERTSSSIRGRRMLTTSWNQRLRTSDYWYFFLKSRCCKTQIGPVLHIQRV